MSVGNPKKFELTKSLVKKEIEKEVVPEAVNEISRVHKDKNDGIKKELAFTTKNNRSKLA